MKILFSIYFLCIALVSVAAEPKEKSKPSKSSSAVIKTAKLMGELKHVKEKKRRGWIEAHENIDIQTGEKTYCITINGEKLYRWENYEAIRVELNEIDSLINDIQFALDYKPVGLKFGEGRVEIVNQSGFELHVLIEDGKVEMIRNNIFALPTVMLPQLQEELRKALTALSK